MKKIFALLLLFVLLFMFTACGEKSELLFKNDELLKSTSVYYDINSDGKDEEIEFTVTDDGFLLIRANDWVTDLGEGYLYALNAVYGLDIDKNDGEKEIAVITYEMSDDAFLRVLRWGEEGLYTLDFKVGDYVSDDAYIGYEAEITLNGKNRIKTSERGYLGMWTIEAEYVFDGEAFVKEEKMVNDIVRSSYAYYENEEAAELMGGDLIDYGILQNEEEIELLKKGYVMAHADHNGTELKCPYGNSVRLLKGDIFKITKESRDGFLYIEKKGGKSGWIYLGDFADNRYDVSPLAFFMAD